VVQAHREGAERLVLGGHGERLTGRRHLVNAVMLCGCPGSR
jgi:hypothetical protein